MIGLWVPVTVAGAFLQCVRTAMQKQLTGRLSANGATYCRFIYGAPIAVAFFAGLIAATGEAVPSPGPVFFVNALAGAVAQIVATTLLILSFGYRNFAVGTVYSKTEAMQTALFGMILLGEPVSFGGFLAILVSAAGVMLLSMAKTRTGVARLLTGLTDKAALLGLASGALFGVSAVTIRGASLSLGDGDFLVRATFTLAVVTTVQTVLMSGYFLFREREQPRLVLRTWRLSGLVGITSVLGSFCWFTAMTIQNAAYVRTLGQVELVFTFIASYFVFKERTTREELGGVLLIVVGIVMLLNLH